MRSKLTSAVCIFLVVWLASPGMLGGIGRANGIGMPNGVGWPNDVGWARGAQRSSGPPAALARCSFPSQASSHSGPVGHCSAGPPYEIYSPYGLYSPYGSYALAGGSGAPNSRTAIQHASLVLDWYVNSDHGGLFTAVQRGFLRRHGIAMSAYVPSDTSAQIQLVAAGRADFGISYETDLLAARAHGIPVRSVMCIMQHPLNTVMTLKSSGITRPRQLAGHTIGAAGSPSDRPIVAALMAHDGSSIDRVRMVNVGYNLLASLLHHQVDAVVGVYWTWEAIQAQMRGYPVNVMRVERWGVPNYCELVLIASEHTISTRAAFVRSTVAAIQQGYAYAATHPSAAWDALHAQDRSLQQSLVMRSLRLLGPIETGARTVGYQDPAQWRRYAAWLATNKLIDRSVSASAAFTNQFLMPDLR